jgi:hypothetical protein
MGSLNKLYGADWVAAEYVGLSRPKPFRFLAWQHGWFYNPSRSGLSITGTFTPKARNLHLVARDEEATFLRGEGFLAKPVGLPFAYTREPQETREQGTVLFFPDHSTGLDQVVYGQSQSAFKNYIEDVIRETGWSGSISLHADDFQDTAKRAFWEAVGLSVILGAAPLENNTLQNQRTRLTKFDYVVTQGYTSAIAYASFSGAKVSVWPETVPSTWDVQEPRHIDNPSLIIEEVEELKAREPWLFCWAPDALQSAHWGAEQIGYHYKASPSDMRKILGWDFYGEFRGRALTAYVEGKKVVRRLRRR